MSTSCKSRKKSRKSSTVRRKRTRDDFTAWVLQDGDQVALTAQDSEEAIIIKDSCEIDVQTTNTQAAVSLQVGLQLAIALVISITLGDTDRSQKITQDLFQQDIIKQVNEQKIIIDNSKNVSVVTKDTDIAVNIQALLQILLALVVRLDVL